jgi:hypothetical protein
MAHLRHETERAEDDKSCAGKHYELQLELVDTL